MSEDDQTPAARPGEEAAEQEPARPHRVIGTPPPAATARKATLMEMPSATLEWSTLFTEPAGRPM